MKANRDIDIPFSHKCYSFVTIEMSVGGTSHDYFSNMNNNLK